MYNIHIFLIIIKRKLFIMQNFKFIIVLLCFIQINIEATPTQRHLELHSLEEITETLNLMINEEILNPMIIDKIPHFLEIASHEDEDTFFGYHGMSQNGRLFQDILNIVFEAVLHINIPKDFYFLRIPGESTWNWENGKEDFFNYFKKPVSQLHKDLILNNFLKKIEKELGFNFQLEDLNPIEYSTIWNFFQDHIDYMIQIQYINKGKEYSMPTSNEWQEPILNKNLPDLIAIITQKAHETDPNIDFQVIQEWFSENFKDLYDNCIILQLRELELEDKERIKGEIGNLDVPFDDTEAPQNSMLISLNASILGNYVEPGSFTANIFAQNKSVLGGDDNLEETLKDFFSQIGLDPSLASVLWNEGQKMLLALEDNYGCILQFFDESARQNEKALSLVDRDVYVSFKHGIPVTDLVPSKYIQGDYLLEKVRKDLQLRLVVNNKTTLNPFSKMRIVRHEGFKDQSQSTQFILMMKEILKESPKDEIKLQSYLDLLEKLWDVPQAAFQS